MTGMVHVLYLLPDLEDSGPARQVSFLAQYGRPWTSEVFSIAGDGPLTAEFRAAGICVLGLLGRAPKDLRGWLALRWLPPTPDRGVVHAFGLGPFRRFMFATVGTPRPRVIVSLTGRERLTWLDRRFLRSAHRVLVPHRTAANTLIARGVSKERVEIVPPAVAPAPPAVDRAALRAEYGFPGDAPLAVTSARLDAFRRLSDAIWSFEFIRLAEPTTRLLIVGDGPARPALERFSTRSPRRARTSSSPAGGETCPGC
jgi:glycosyltransferase involved in cell wall biosynthesis